MTLIIPDTSRCSFHFTIPNKEPASFINHSLTAIVDQRPNPNHATQLIYTNSTLTTMTSSDDRPADTTDKDSKIVFFCLPRELRDEIYGLTFEHNRTTTQGREIMELNVRAPLPHLRLVNKQFTQEYDERSPSTDNICLFITGASPTGNPLSARGFTYAAQASAINITLTFDPFDDSLHEYVPSICFWLFDLVKDLPHVKTVNLELRFAIPLTLETINWFSRIAHRAVPSINRWFTHVQRKHGMSPLVQITQVGVMLVIPKGTSDSTDSASDGDEKVATWTPARGYVEDVGLTVIRRKYGKS
jgi:hypothetical protein